MMTKHYCKRCFKAVVDPNATDTQLLMSPEGMFCSCCEETASIVAAYFKYGEHTVTPDGKHIVGESRHVGVNPDYSFWGFSYPYAE